MSRPDPPAAPGQPDRDGPARDHGTNLLPFADREAAGRALAAHLLAHHKELGPGPEAKGMEVLVLALPRGGVPVARIVAEALGAPLDLLLVRKIGAPWEPELAVAALVDGQPPEIVIDREMCARTGADDQHVAREAKAALQENERRRRLYLGGRAAPPVAGRTVIVVDDGVATGTTLRAALLALRKQHPARLVVAVPVSSREAAARLRAEADEWVCLAEPVPFEAVGRHYLRFGQVGDDEVVRLLAEAAAAHPDAQAPAPPGGIQTPSVSSMSPGRHTRRS